eukprot:2717872-Pyramimonas_sp.AAC.2
MARRALAVQAEFKCPLILDEDVQLPPEHPRGRLAVDTELDAAPEVDAIRGSREQPQTYLHELGHPTAKPRDGSCATACHGEPHQLV